MFGMQVEITASQGKGKALGEIMSRASQLVSNLDGCKLYLVQESSTLDDTILISEVWQSQGLHQASLAVPDVIHLISEARPLIATMRHHTAVPLAGFN